MDAMDYEVLEDGTISITTGNISQTNHVSADEFVELLERRMGGEVMREKREDAHAHAHRHHHVHA